MAEGQVTDANGIVVEKTAPLGEAGAGPALANAEAVVVSRDTNASPDPAAVTAAEAAVAAAKTPEEKTAAQAALDKIKPAVTAPVVDPAALAAAEKAVADAKTPEEKAAAEKKLADLKSPPVDKPGVAPEAYTDFVVPEGVILPAEVAKDFGVLAKELSLSQSQAQRLVDFQSKQALAGAQAQAKAWEGLLNDRLAESKADPEVGGTHFDENIGSARKAIEAFGTPGLQKYLNTSDAGSHVEIIRLLSKVGKAISEDTIHFGGKAPAGEQKDLAERLFPSAKPA